MFIEYCVWVHLQRCNSSPTINAIHVDMSTNSLQKVIRWGVKMPLKMKKFSQQMLIAYTFVILLSLNKCWSQTLFAILLYWILCVSYFLLVSISKAMVHNNNVLDHKHSFAKMQFKSHHKCYTCCHENKHTSKGDILRSKDDTKSGKFLSTNVDRKHFSYITFCYRLVIFSLVIVTLK